MTISEFLLARIAEDEALAREEDDDYADTTLLPTYDSEHQANWNTARVLAECAAKREIIEQHAPYGDGGNSCSTGADWPNMLYDRPDNVAWPCPTLRALAAVYADHPDYQPEWAQEASQA